MDSSTLTWRFMSIILSLSRWQDMDLLSTYPYALPYRHEEERELANLRNKIDRRQLPKSKPKCNINNPQLFKVSHSLQLTFTLGINIKNHIVTFTPESSQGKHPPSPWQGLWLFMLVDYVFKRICSKLATINEYNGWSGPALNFPL